MREGSHEGTDKRMQEDGDPGESVGASWSLWS